MGSTVYFRIDDERRLQIAPLEGSARLTVHGQSQTIVEGGYLTVPLTENLQPAAEASVPQSYLGDESIASLALVPLVQPMEFDPGLEQAELDLLLAYEPVLDYLQIEDSDEFLVYLTEAEIPDLPAWLLEAGYEDFGDELEFYLEENLGYDLDNYPEYTGDDEPIYYDDGFEEMAIALTIPLMILLISMGTGLKTAAMILSI